MVATPQAHPDHTTTAVGPCFEVGVVAPLNFNPPGLDRFARNKLRSLLVSKRRTHRIGGWGVFGEPVTRAFVDLLQQEFSVNLGGVGAWTPYGRYVEHLRAMLRLATMVDALVVIHGGGRVPADVGRVVDACRWMRTAVRVLVYAGDPVPL